MRKFVSILFFISAVTGFAQPTPLSFPDSGAVWSISFVFNANFQAHNPYGTAGDTLINGIPHVRVVQSNDTFFNPNNSTYFCAVREFQNRWYFVPAGVIVEYLLYDFNLTVGDTVTIDNPWSSNMQTDQMVVGSIDSLQMLDGSYRSQWNMFSLSGVYHESWVAGVGSTLGLIYPTYALGLAGEGYALICYHEMGVSLFTPSFFPTPNDCYYNYSLGIVDNASKTAQLHIHPNPGNDHFTIDLPQEFVHGQLVISDVHGRVVIASDVNPETAIDTKALSPGTYLVEVMVTNGSTWSTKWIKR